YSDGNDSEVWIAEKFILYFAHVAVHDRANCRAGRKKEFNHVNLAFHLFARKRLASVRSEFVLRRFAYRKQFFVLAPFAAYVVQTLATNDIVCLKALHNLGNSPKAEQKHNCCNSYVGFILEHQILRLEALLFRFSAALYS